MTQGNTLWALADHLGSIRDVVDNNGVVRQHLVFDSFGRRVREVDYNASGIVIANNDPAAVDELFGYTARDFDAAVGLQYNRARWYDANTGRWMSHDPIGFGGGDANLSRYVGNEPTSSVDPTGNSKVKVIIKVGGKIEKVLHLSYEELRSILRARVKDAQKPIPQRKYTGEVFVQVKDVAARQ